MTALQCWNCGVYKSVCRYAELRRRRVAFVSVILSQNHVFYLWLDGGTSGTVIAVVVVCLAFLVGVIALAVVRIRNVQRRRKNNPNLAVEDGPEMEWDNSTLNVTVNPFESVSEQGT